MKYGSPRDTPHFSHPQSPPSLLRRWFGRSPHATLPRGLTCGGKVVDGMEKLWWRSALRVIYSSTYSCSALLAVRSPQRLLCVSFPAREAARHTGKAELPANGSPAKLTSQEGSQQVARRHNEFLQTRNFTDLNSRHHDSTRQTHGISTLTIQTINSTHPLALHTLKSTDL